MYDDVMLGVSEAVDQVVAVDVSQLDTAQLEAETLLLQRQINRLQGQVGARAAALAARDGDDEDTAGWLSRRTRMSRWSARQHVLVGTRLQRLPSTAAALAAGRIGFDHARVIATAATDDRADAALRDEADLVGAAVRMTPAGLRRHCDAWRMGVDADGGEEAAADVYEQRRFAVGDPDPETGMAWCDGQLDPEGATIVHAGLAAARDATAKPDDDRTRDQRDADALVDMARHYLQTADAPVRSGRRPHLLLRADLSTLRGGAGSGELLHGRGGQYITAEALRRLTCDANVSRIITDGPSLIVDVGHTTRTIPVGTRKALIARDEGCRGEHCEARIETCEGHHIRHWVDLGPTALRNLVLLCPFHHHRIHHGGWTLTRDPDGRHTLRPPPGLRAQLAPRRAQPGRSSPVR